MMTRAAPISCAPKNMGVHAALSASWTKYRFSTGPRPMRFHTIHAAVAIMRYSTVHTGPKIHEGGFHEGLTSD